MKEERKPENIQPQAGKLVRKHNQPNSREWNCQPYHSTVANLNCTALKLDPVGISHMIPFLDIHFYD